MSVQGVLFELELSRADRLRGFVQRKHELVKTVYFCYVTFVMTSLIYGVTGSELARVALEATFFFPLIGLFVVWCYFRGVPALLPLSWPRVIRYPLIAAAPVVFLSYSLYYVIRYGETHG